MSLPGSDKFLEAVITDLSLVEPLRVAGEFVQGINRAVSLLGDLLSGPFECLWHPVERTAIPCRAFGDVRFKLVVSEGP